MRVLLTLVASLSIVVGLAGAVSAEGTVIFEDELTKPSDAFSDEDDDIAAVEFSAGGMTVAGVNKGKAQYISPLTDYGSQEQLLTTAIEVTAAAGNKKTAVGVFCRRSEANGGYVFLLTGKKYQVLEHDELDQLKLVSSGTAKNAKPGKPNRLRAECSAKKLPEGDMVTVLEVNGRPIYSDTFEGTPQSGGVGLALLPTDKKSTTLGTFRDFKIYELPPPTS